MRFNPQTIYRRHPELFMRALSVGGHPGVGFQAWLGQRRRVSSTDHWPTANLAVRDLLATTMPTGGAR